MASLLDIIIVNISRLTSRVQDTDLYKKKLVQELYYLNDENDKLVLSRYEINHAIEMLKKPEDVIIHNLKAREFRQGIDLVEDNVQVSLRHENQEIRRVRNLMEQLSDKVESQISKNEDMKKNLKQNICEKTRALDIDNYCSRLNNISTKISPHPNIEIVSRTCDIKVLESISNRTVRSFFFPLIFMLKDIKTRSGLQSWQQKTDAMMTRSCEARCQSEEIRGKVESLISTSSMELSSAWAQTNIAFDERIAETESARREAQQHVEKTNMVTLIREDFLEK